MILFTSSYTGVSEGWVPFIYGKGFCPHLYVMAWCLLLTLNLLTITHVTCWQWAVLIPHRPMVYYGKHCRFRQPQYWGLSEDPEGCQPCECDVGGSFDNNCDQQTGQCNCRPNIIGRRCDQPAPGYFVPNLDHYVYEGEESVGTGVSNGNLTLYELNFSEGTKTCAFYVNPLHWHVTGSWNPSPKTGTYLFYIVSIMAADVLATQGASASASMILT